MSMVLVTGALGAVGRPVCRALMDAGHEVRTLDLAATDSLPDHHVGSVADAELLLRVAAGMDAVIHLAAEPNDAPFTTLLEPNVLGLYSVLNAARTLSVKRVVLASSIQVLGYRGDAPKPARVTEASPSNHYALTKLWAESMGEMYARKYGIDILAARIAWMVRNPVEASKMEELGRFEIYLSAEDAGRFFLKTIEAKLTGFSIAYAVSCGGEAEFDMEPAERLLGFKANDRWPAGLGFPWPAKPPTA